MPNNSTPGSESSDHESGYDQGFKIAIIVILSVSAVLGFIGNALVVAVIFRAKKLRSVMNRFVLHLAISDLIVCALCIPLFLVVNFMFAANKNESAGNLALVKCKATRFLQYLAPEASMTILITIGLNRHRAVVHPLHMMTYSTANKLIAAAWAYAMVVVIPSLYLTEVKPVNVNSTAMYCATIPGTLLGRLYTMFLAIFGYLIPLTTLIVLYGKICKTVWLRQKNNLGQTLPAKAYIQSRKKVLKMFLTVISIFIVTWLPLLIYVGAIESTNPSPSYIDYTRLIVYSIGLCNSICNPFIYALFNPKFRASVKELFASFRLFAMQLANRTTAGGAESLSSDDFKKRELNRHGGVRATDSSSKKKEKKMKKLSSSQTTAEKNRRKTPFYLRPKQQSFVLNQDELYRSHTSISAVSETCVELTMFQTTGLANDVKAPPNETERK